MDVKIFGGNVKWEIESADAARNFKAAATLFIAHLTFPI